MLPPCSPVGPDYSHYCYLSGFGAGGQASSLGSVISDGAACFFRLSSPTISRNIPNSPVTTETTISRAKKPINIGDDEARTQG